MFTTRANRVRNRGYITSPIQQALYNKLIEQPYLHRYKMADFLYCRFCTRVAERSIGRTIRSIGWTRKTVHGIAQQRDADLRDYYLYRMSKYESYQLSLLMNLAVVEGRDIGVGDGLQWGLPPSMSQSLVVEKDGTFFQHMLGDQSFDSDESLQQYPRDSTIHAPSFDCDDYDWSSAAEPAELCTRYPASVPTPVTFPPILPQILDNYPILKTL